jgi:hypothetical protein
VATKMRAEIGHRLDPLNPPISGGLFKASPRKQEGLEGVSVGLRLDVLAGCRRKNSKVSDRAFIDK